MTLPRITLFGAGCIGSYLAGVLLPKYTNERDKLAIVARKNQCDLLKSKGLFVSDYIGNKHITPNILNVFEHNKLNQTKPNAAHILLLSLKCTALTYCISELSHCIDKNTIIICLQNGVGSELAIKQAFPDNMVLKAIVGFNVVKLSNGFFHKATEGELVFEQHQSPYLLQLVQILNIQQTKAYTAQNFEEIQWAKLLLNLNNAVNALAGIPLKEELAQHTYRKILATAISETLKVLKKLNIKPAKLTPVPPSLLPFILKLPTPLFTQVARKMLAIAPQARSSMWYDLEEKKPTEIDFINGAVVQLGKQVNVSTPINNNLTELIKKYSTDKQGSPKLSGEVLVNKMIST